jgi:hypothetical protein
MFSFSYIKKYLYSETSQVPVRNKAPNSDRGYDNVLLGQGYRTPRGIKHLKIFPEA